MPVRRISTIVPDVDVYLTLEPEEIAFVTLENLNSFDEREQQHINRHNYGMHYTIQEYPQEKWQQCQQALMEGWMYLEAEGLVAYKPGDNSSNYFLTNRGKQFKTQADVSAFRNARYFPKHSIHPLLLEKVFPLYLRGEYETAVFQSFLLVEIAVRDAARLEPRLIGTDLMRKAFNDETGTLTRLDEPVAERKSLQDLFAGAIGRFKNPSSHRHIEFSSPTEAIELIQFASHLLKIVDERVPITED